MLSRLPKKAIALRVEGILVTMDNESLMLRYGIQCETKLTYRYKQYRYDNPEDALRYAKIDSERQSQDSTPIEKPNYVQ